MTASSSFPQPGGRLHDRHRTGCDRKEYDRVVEQAGKALLEWRTWPAPKRGEVVRQIGEELRAKKHALGNLVSYEMGKSLPGRSG